MNNAMTAASLASTIATLRTTLASFTASTYDEGRATAYRVGAYSLENMKLCTAVKNVSAIVTDEANLIAVHGATFAAGQVAGAREVLAMINAAM